MAYEYFVPGYGATSLSEDEFIPGYGAIPGEGGAPAETTPTQEQFMRHGKYTADGIQQPFWWSK